MHEDEPGEVRGPRRLRLLNERMRERVEEFQGTKPNTYLMMCECPDVDCEQMLEVAREDYEGVRAEPAAFLVARAHVREPVMRLIRELGEFSVVEIRV